MCDIINIDNVHKKGLLLMKKRKTIGALLTPDYYFEKFDDITPEFLHSKGISALLIDIDNTIAPYEVAVPDKRIADWFAMLRENGISAAFISNNNQERVALFNRELGILAYANSGKPSTKTLRIAIEKMGSTLDNTASLGDQLLTDALAAHRLGIPVIIVPPIKDKKNLFFRFKRAIERPYMKKFFKKLESEKKNDK